jgi:two-component system response regulator QseB
VLLVEDDLVSASALRTILTRRGFEVIHVITVADAKLRLSDNPAFVILDLMLPDGDGIAVLQSIRDAGMTSRVVVTTAVSDHDRLRSVQALKPEIVLQKPIDLTLLLNSLRPVN